MKSTALPLPAKAGAKSAVSIFQIIFAKKGVFFLFNVLLAGITFLSARCNILTYCSPFAFALACAAPGELLPAAVIGAAAGYLTSGYEIVPARYLAALIFAIIMRRIFSEKAKKNPLFSALIALLGCALSGIVTSVLLDEVQVTLLPYTAESFIAAASALFWAGSFHQLKKMKSLSALNESETAGLLISVFLIILSLSYIRIYNISLSGVLACLTILFSAYYGKTGAGAMAGIGGGMALGFGSGNALSFASLSVGGLFAGLGATHSRLLSAVALESGIAVPLLFGADSALDYTPFLEAGIACIVFFLLPKRLLNTFRFLHVTPITVGTASLRAQAVSRLRCASDALGDVCTGLYEIKEKSTAAVPAKKTSIYINTMHNTCEKCGLKYYCWEKQKERTVSVFKQIEKQLEEQVALTPETLPQHFGEVCIRSKVLLKNFILEHTAFMANQLAAKKAESMREVMSIQFDALAQLLFDLSEDMEQKEIPDADKTDALLELLEYCGAEFLNAAVLTDEHLHLRIHLRIPYRQEVLEKAAFLEDLQSICSATFEAPQIVELDNSVSLNYYEKSLYRCEFGACQINAADNRYCGDAYELLKDYRGKSTAVLADGMGNGLLAHLNASLSTRIMAKLLSAGFSVGAAIKVANAALMVKDNEESFSSLDLVKVDLFTGKADFYKAGAAFSTVLKKDSVLKVELAGMPIGILENADFSRSSLHLSEGDIIVLVSDGVTQGNSEWLRQLLAAKRSESPQTLAKEIAATARRKADAAHRDDISAVCIRLQKNE